MSSQKIDPATLASIHARQDYQQEMDAYYAAEERRLIRRANFGRQTVMGLVAFIAASLFFWLVPMPPQFPVYLFVMTFIGGTVALLFVSFLAASRPTRKPDGE